MDRIRTALLILPFILLVACAGKKDGLQKEQVLAVSIEPQRNVLEHLVDSNYTVVSLLSRGTNPETFDPSASERKKVDAAKIYFTTGVLPFEHKIEKSTVTPIVNTADGIDLLFGTHGHAVDEGHGHDADPHYWNSIAGARGMAHNMAAALAKADPEHAAEIEKRLKAYEHHLDSLDAAVRGIISGCDNRIFAVWHPSLSYIARDYDMRQITLGIEGKEMSAKGLREAIDAAKTNNVRVFFFQQEYDSRQAEAASNSMGTRVVEINPLDYDWETQLITIANEIARP